MNRTFTEKAHWGQTSLIIESEKIPAVVDAFLDIHHRFAKLGSPLLGLPSSNFYHSLYQRHFILGVKSKNKTRVRQDLRLERFWHWIKLKSVENPRGRFWQLHIF
jgi:hypothetical protein